MLLDPADQPGKLSRPAIDMPFDDPPGGGNLLSRQKQDDGSTAAEYPMCRMHTLINAARTGPLWPVSWNLSSSAFSASANRGVASGMA